ncbi:hypothetical protein KCMC57_up11980 [Kitasatospora sp. CMC57]|uniref:YidE/YbjL duplication domain-containing protein n=1 Tax=Kitasatospora sp. CMC57 TaxID=3231513 RepID=A0AB33JPV5_9ACTN
MDWITDHVFKPYPELPIFLTIAIGFLVGKIRYRSIGLGAVTGCLVAGLFTGWVTDVSVNGTVKSVFFIMFLFALGYKVGPQFFRGLRKDGLPQVTVTVVVCVTGLLVCWGVAEMLGYGPGLGAGLLGGALTQSAVIGVAQDAIGNIQGLGRDQVTEQQNLVPVAYAVTYPLGTILCAVLLANIAPRLLRSDLAADSRALAIELDAPEADPDLAEGYYEVVLRAYTVAGGGLAGRTIDDIESQQREQGRRIYLTRVRRAGEILDHTQQTVIRQGDVVAVSALRHDLVDFDPARQIGPESDDAGLLGYRTEHLHVVVSAKEYLGRTVAQVRREPFMVGVFVDRIYRSGAEFPLPALHRAGVRRHPGADQRRHRHDLGRPRHLPRRLHRHPVAYRGRGADLALHLGRRADHGSGLRLDPG